MSERLEEAIKKVIYWNDAYRDSRDKFIKTGDKKYDHRMYVNNLHLLASSRFLKIVYERETGERIETIGNLPPVNRLNESRQH